MNSKKLYPGVITGEINPPASKSASHRALILTAFGNNGSTIGNLLFSEDIKATKQALIQMGAEFEEEDKNIMQVKMASHGGGKIDCLNSGTTLRLLTGINSLYSDQTELFGDASLMTRPMQPLVDALKQLGAKISTVEGKPPIVISQPIGDNDTTHIRGDTSSQFISSLILMSALREGKKTTISLLPPVVSRPYIELTIQMLKRQNIMIEFEGNQIIVKGSNNFGKVNLVVPSDMSSVAFFAVAGAFPGNSIKFRNIDFEIPQADGEIFNIIREAGAEVNVSRNEVIITGRELKGVEWDISQCPDIFPILCVLAACSKGTSRYYNARHLRIKEVDRIKASLHNLHQVGISFEELEDGAIIHGGEIKGGVTLESFHDHRIAMAASILATQASEPIELNDFDCVAVSYPDFYNDLNNVLSIKKT